jgi:hypothetical protein
MAKRSRSRTSRRSAARRGGRNKSIPLINAAKDFIAAEERYRDAEAAFRAARDDLASLRASLVRHIGTADDAAHNDPARGRASRGSRPTRALREGSLGSHILAVFSDRTQRTMPEVFEAVQRAGFKSKGKPKSQLVMVAQTLSKLVKRGELQRVSRGSYAKA